MGKIIKDGFAFMEYVNSGLIRKTDDIPELKNRVIALSESKTHVEMSRYAVRLAEHILDFSGIERSDAIDECISINMSWRNKEVKFQEARRVAGMINSLARLEENEIKTKVLRAMGQVAATPHVRWHALCASEYAIVITNLMYPKDLEKAKEERIIQLEMMNNLYYNPIVEY